MRLPADRLVVLAALSGAVAVGATGSAIASRTTSFTVSSTLSQKHVLPHRIHWLGKPSLPPSKIREIDFRIDGRQAWVEHHAPYSYGYDGNYLVTSWMRPGLHTFTVVAVATNGRRARISSRARTGPAKAPPAALAGSWQRQLSAADARGSGPAGVWTLTVSSVGWRILDPTRERGALIDVAYLASNAFEARGGIATRAHDPRENNLWCDEPFEPVRYHWRVAANRLTIALAGPRRCHGQSRVWAGDWTRR
jgi:hypothetical protein